MSLKKVMILDDDKHFLDQLGELLTLSGYEMVAVNDAVKAVDVAVKTHPDIVVLDIKMPGRNGFQVAADLRQLSVLKNVPLIAMTGFYSREEGKQIIQAFKIDKCLIKPFRPLDVIASIEELLLAKEEKYAK